jgi:hypothetical protein
MAGHSRPKDGVLLHAFVPAIHVLLCGQAKDVDAGERRDLILTASPTAHMPARQVRYKE